MAYKSLGILYFSILLCQTLSYPYADDQDDSELLQLESEGDDSAVDWSESADLAEETSQSKSAPVEKEAEAHRDPIEVASDVEALSSSENSDRKLSSEEDVDADTAEEIVSSDKTYEDVQAVVKEADPKQSEENVGVESDNQPGEFPSSELSKQVEEVVSDDLASVEEPKDAVSLEAVNQNENVVSTEVSEGGKVSDKESEYSDEEQVPSCNLPYDNYFGGYFRVDSNPLPTTVLVTLGDLVAKNIICLARKKTPSVTIYKVQVFDDQRVCYYRITVNKNQAPRTQRNCLTKN